MAKTVEVVSVNVERTVEDFLQLYDSLRDDLQERYAVYLYYLVERMKWEVKQDLEICH